MNFSLLAQLPPRLSVYIIMADMKGNTTATMHVELPPEAFHTEFFVFLLILKELYLSLLSAAHRECEITSHAHSVTCIISFYL